VVSGHEIYIDKICLEEKLFWIRNSSSNRKRVSRMAVEDLVSEFEEESAL
jgi:hypothetical protein